MVAIFLLVLLVLATSTMTVTASVSVGLETGKDHDSGLRLAPFLGGPPEDEQVS